jgi:hypothetical protein
LRKTKFFLFLGIGQFIKKTQFSNIQKMFGCMMKVTKNEKEFCFITERKLKLKFYKGGRRQLFGSFW